jgi:hypothetical protein
MPGSAVFRVVDRVASPHSLDGRTQTRCIEQPAKCFEDRRVDALPRHIESQPGRRSRESTLPAGISRERGGQIE